MKSVKKTRKPKKHAQYLTVQKICFIIIAICFVLVIAYLIYSLINTPEKRIKSLISQLSTEYYEDHLYANFSKNENFKNDPAGVMKLYEENGFSPITIRQLLLYDNQKNAKYADALKKYCDENKTLIKFYPKAPYQKESHHIEYTYSCDF